MSWLTALLSAGFVLLGGGLILWWVRKPSIRLNSIDFTAWWFIYDGDTVKGVSVEINLTLSNNGETGSYVSTCLELDLRQGLGQIVIKEGEQIFVDGRGQRLQKRLYFVHEYDPTVSIEQVEITSFFVLRPWGARKLPFLSPVIERRLVIPYNQQRQLYGIL